MPLDVSLVRITGRWFRQSPAGAPGVPDRLPPPDNRWQRGDVVDALYLADREATTWAEWYRHLAEAGLPPLEQMPRELWAWEVDVEVADLSTVERLAQAGLEPPRPGRATWPAYQAAGEELWRDGADGLLAPSAALPAGLTLCLFRPRQAAPRGATPGGRPERFRRPPAPPTGMAT